MQAPRSLMADSQVTDNASPPDGDSDPGRERTRLRRWLFPLLRIVFLIFAAWLIWYTAGHWDRWTGAARFESTDDAFVAGDVTPLSARVSGYITEMPVNDFQTVRKGDLIAVIDPSDYKAQLDLAQANLAAARGDARQSREPAHRPAGARPRGAGDDRRQPRPTCCATSSRIKRQRNLYKTGIAGTQQVVEQADANAQKALAQRRLNEAQLDQQKAALAAIDIQEKQLQRPDPCGGSAGRARRRQSALHANSLARRRPGRPAASAARPIRQRRHASDRRRSAAEHLGGRQLQGNPDDQHPAPASRPA